MWHLGGGGARPSDAPHFPPSLLQVGDTFVLNCLGEDDYAGTMRHFLKRFAPGGAGGRIGIRGASGEGGGGHQVGGVIGFRVRADGWGGGATWV